MSSQSKIYTALFLLFYIFNSAYSQNNSIMGIITDESGPVIGANVFIPDLNKGTITDLNGAYNISSLPSGTFTIEVKYLGYLDIKEKIDFKENEKKTINFVLQQDIFKINEVVVTGTKTFKRQTDSPVIVSIMDSKTLNNLQVCNLSEGLKFQPGLRIETDCQTCNYTQLRMNGLQGGYSQILINGRPIFSPLMGLYGMEQLPVSMIERIEVVRGGGSSLYGSSAIGGTVNVITKLPKKSGYEVNTFYQNIGNQTSDFNLSSNATLVNEEKNAGITFFLNKRNRGFYDANGDNFSELSKLENTSLGFNSYYQFTDNQKLELSISNLNEYRFGGEMTDKPAFLTQQSEERYHRIWMGSADYQINFNKDKSSLIFYSAFQNTGRNHYTGIFPDEDVDIQNHIENPPYGVSQNTTIQGGFQLNHELSQFLGGRNVMTLGTEYISDKVFDEIPSYNYLVDQHTKNFGAFLQSDWDITSKINLLSGIRVDQHNFVDNLVYNPRIALLVKPATGFQYRLSYGTGFRAPQAFDSDLHIAFAGGGVSRVQLSPNLAPEISQSFSTSLNYDKVTNKYIYGFTLEGFYTRLDDAFILENIAEDAFGLVFEKSNGQSANVQGITLELRTNYNKKVQFEAGFTLQKSLFEEPVQYIDEVEPVREFLRTPNDYGFANLTFTPSNKWNINLNYVYTGRMKLAHFGGADNFPNDAFLTSQSFSEVSSKISYLHHIHKFENDIEFYGGVKNIFNAFQNDFDKGKNRDSNYIYGPGMPRTVFLGIKISMN